MAGSSRRYVIKRPKQPKRPVHLQAEPLNEAQEAALQAGKIPLAELQLPKRAKFRQFMKMAVNRFFEAQIGAMSAALAYYTLLALFPMAITVGNLLPIFGFDYNSISRYLAQLVPEDIMNYINPIIRSLSVNTSGGLLSVGAIATLWTASLGINGLRTGFNKAYGVDPPKNYITSRLVSMVVMSLLVVAIGALMLAFAFGRQFLEWIVPILGLSDAWLNTFNTWRWPVTVAALIVVICFMDYVLPSVRLKFWTILPGAAFTIAAWLSLAQIFSWYMRHFGTRFSSYGTIGTVLVLMLWLDFMAMMLLIGAVLNALVAEYFTGAPRHSSNRARDFVVRRVHNYRVRAQSNNKSESAQKK